MNASIERATSTVASDTYFLGEMSAQEFENMTFEMAEAVTALHAEVFRSLEGATTVKPFRLEILKFSSFPAKKSGGFQENAGSTSRANERTYDRLREARQRIIETFRSKG